MKIENINKLFDNTLLKPEATWQEIEDIVDESLEYKFRNVVVPWYAVPYAVDRVRGTEVGVNIGIGFPLGYVPTEIKLREIDYYINLGPETTDFDMVANISLVKSDKWDAVKRELTLISEAVKKHDRITKIIIETSRLTDDEIRKICEVIMEIPTIDFVKTGTGFGPRATTLNDVKIIHSIVKGIKKIKVSGGVRTLGQVEEYIAHGADIFGASASLSILNEYNKKNSD
ncbi:MAG TPA: deoxyribose-phosphate aldolase [Thermotogota bacterium]|nr:deoxyribose-phosphate aldolase [Thermotogota bacterium]HPR97263.1 deoxyribose-phosphate aldolase [Thermotogota bacterium]